MGSLCIHLCVGTWGNYFLRLFLMQHVAVSLRAYVIMEALSCDLICQAGSLSFDFSMVEIRQDLGKVFSVFC